MENKNKINKNNNKKPSPLWIYGGIAILFLIISVLFDSAPKGKEVGWKKLSDLLRNKEIERIVIINKEVAEIYLTEEAKSKETGENNTFARYTKVPDYYMNIGSLDAFERRLDELQNNIPPEKRVDVQYEKRTDYVGSILSWLIPIIFFFVIWFFLFKKISGGGAGGGGQIFNIGKSKAKVFDKENKVKVTFTDVAGLEEAKEEVKEIVDFLKSPNKYTKLGGKIPKGVLLVGPPGTGKTLLARAVAGEAEVPFFSLSGSDFVEMFVGVGASRVRDLFKQAKDKSPCIIFIDEIDAIGRARGRSVVGGNDERESTLNQLLTEMDGFEPNSGIIVIAATNRADILDPALLRAGRFDRQIHLDLPNLVERKEIFKVHTKNLKLAEDVNIEQLSKQTPGFSGADIANVCNEAALIAARKNKDKIYMEDFMAAIDRVIAGLEKRTRIITKKEKKTIAVHESGHAIVSWMLKYAHALVKVSIVPRGRTLGAAWYMPEERQITTYEQILDEMCATLGGRAAEETMFDTISTGALDDLERVTKRAYALISYFGMGEKIKNLSYYDSTHDYDGYLNRPYSEKTAEEIDEEVRKIVEVQYERAKRILAENKDKLEALSELLKEKETIFADDVERILGVSKAMPENEMEEEVEEKDKSDIIDQENRAVLKDADNNQGEVKNANKETDEESINNSKEDK